MKTIDLEELKKKRTIKDIILMHCHDEINLTGKQIDELLKEKNKEKLGSAKKCQ